MNKKIITILISAVTFIVISFMIFANRGFFDVYRCYRKVNNRSAELNAARLTLDSLKIERDRLLHDTAHIERIARERLGMAAKDEIIIQFVEENQ